MKKVFYLMLLCVTIVCLSSCSKDDDAEFAVNTLSYTIKPNKTTKIDGIGLSNISWNSSNEFVATAVNEKITSGYVGDCTLQYGNVVLSVNVKPEHNLYTEPKLSWGASLSKIKAGNGTPYYSSNSLLIYKSGNSAAPYNVYMFESGYLSSIGVIVNMSYYQTLIKFLTERYMVTDVSSSSYIASFMHIYGKKSQPRSDYSVALAYENNFNGILVGYFKSSSTKSICSNNELNEMLKQLDELN